MLHFNLCFISGYRCYRYPLLLKYSLDAASVNAFYYIHQKLETIKYEIINEEDLLRNFGYIRLQATLPFISEKSTVLDTLQKTRKNVYTFINYTYYVQPHLNLNMIIIIKNPFYF